ncbi:MAG: hypothetical protein P0Y65_04910 [Candidatus Devosia phytovorans]|uniref:Uncharacterized protein n=1 Tax=Candidatus Devosia phytovorans TaxID=3121372 RepID=A0AAJ5VY53_9HYPH|nr:hypothetical protein [Devosia sp.]WEK05599.1 MAG: hypothetical protein P0Y65_04910 [Devosia sp.]
MKFAPAFSLLALLTSLLPVAAFAQDVGSSGSPLPDQPYTLIYPPNMVTGGDQIGGPVTVNHPEMPLQCILAVIPVEDTAWTAEGALASLDAASVAEGWSDTLPGFALGASLVTNYQSGPALQYEGTNAASDTAPATTLVHTETVAEGNGYTLDCLYPTEVAANARPIVDAIIANFSTSQDAQPVTAFP